MCVCVMPHSMTPARSRLDSGVTPAYSQDRALSFHFGLSLGLVFVLSPSPAFISPCSCYYFLVSSSFSLPVFSFFLFGHVPSCSVWPALCVGLAALCLLPVWFRGAVLCRLGRRRCMRLVDIMFFLGVLLARTPVPTATVSPLLSRQRGTLYLPVIDLAPRGESGMDAFAEEADSSASFASSDRPSAVLPIVRPPRGLLVWVS